MPGKAVGRAAVELPWLCPKTDSLIALAENPATVCGLAAADPGLALFLHRFATPAAEPALGQFATGSLASALLPDTAAAFLAATQAGVIPTASFALDKVRSIAERAGTLAVLIAEKTRRCTSQAADSVARLAPVGWYAVASVDQFEATDPLHDPRFRSEPAKVQNELWGLDHAAIARRLATRWKLPPWVGSTLGCLTHSFQLATRIVAHADLFAIVQLAVLEAEKSMLSLGLTFGANRGELLEHLRLEDSALRDLVDESESHPRISGTAAALEQNPHRVPLVRNLLRMSAQSRRRNGPALVDRLEDRVDRLHTVLADLNDLVGERLQTAKLDGLAELAAGAGHEINNPLAVISCNAQRLLRTEPDVDRGESLRAIVRQAHKIASILRDLMHFARPPRPNTRLFPIEELVLGVREDLTPMTLERDVRLEIQGLLPGMLVEGDSSQLRQALGAVVRNGIEAAAPGGWVRITCPHGDENECQIIVEDSGPGMTSEIAEHAFDPFFSGRNAGRGRGLGLPTAWQLARQNGGTLRHEPAEGEPTRFILQLCRGEPEPDVIPLRSA